MTRLYCSKCRDELIHRIARYKESDDTYRRVKVIKANTMNSVVCQCERCGHIWPSRSLEARKLAELAGFI